MRNAAVQYFGSRRPRPSRRRNDRVGPSRPQTSSEAICRRRVSNSLSLAMLLLRCAALDNLSPPALATNNATVCAKTRLPSSRAQSVKCSECRPRRMNPRANPHKKSTCALAKLLSSRCTSNSTLRWRVASDFGGIAKDSIGRSNDARKHGRTECLQSRRQGVIGGLTDLRPCPVQ
jgi:hypothetical protein